MCLLVAILRPGSLVVAANRDERLERPALPMTVLQEQGPRILGGRDLRAGGTWLAINQHGVVAGLTNTPTAAGRDDAKRSRGELPLLAAKQATAAEAVARLAEIDPAAYNPAWMLVGDRESLFAVSISGDKPHIEALGPGVHVLENRAPGAPSAKVDHVRALVGEPPQDTTQLIQRLERVLGDQTPAPASGLEAEPDFDGRRRPPELSAPCVHLEGYGTRAGAIVAVDQARRPRVLAADGPPCEAPFVDQTSLWG